MPPDPFVTVGKVWRGGQRLSTQEIHIDTVATARAHGWWVFEDFEQQFIAGAPASDIPDDNGANDPDEDGA